MRRAWAAPPPPAPTARFSGADISPPGRPNRGTILPPSSEQNAAGRGQNCTRRNPRRPRSLGVFVRPEDGQPGLAVGPRPPLHPRHQPTAESLASMAGRKSTRTRFFGAAPSAHDGVARVFRGRRLWIISCGTDDAENPWTGVKILEEAYIFIASRAETGGTPLLAGDTARFLRSTDIGPQIGRALTTPYQGLVLRRAAPLDRPHPWLAAWPQCPGVSFESTNGATWGTYRHAGPAREMLLAARPLQFKKQFPRLAPAGPGARAIS